MLSILWIILSTNCHVIWFIIALFLIPRVAAQGSETPFPDIPFKLFSSFVKENFSSKITLSQVLLVLFTITDNTDLLSLHARKQNSQYLDKHPSQTQDIFLVLHKHYKKSWEMVKKHYSQRQKPLIQISDNC